jgi:hypothetical protein
LHQNLHHKPTLSMVHPNADNELEFTPVSHFDYGHIEMLNHWVDQIKEALIEFYEIPEMMHLPCQ